MTTIIHQILPPFDFECLANEPDTFLPSTPLRVFRYLLPLDICNSKPRPELFSYVSGLCRLQQVLHGLEFNLLT
jgi:hypothetical protein